MQTGGSLEPPAFWFAIYEFRLRILILEDGPIQSDVLADKLSILFSNKLGLVYTDKLADFNKRIIHDEFDLLIVDLNVLDANGAEVASALLQLAESFRKKVLIHTSESWSSMIRLGLGDFVMLPKGAQVLEFKLVLEKLKVLPRMS